ncbi:hypothetical protein FHS43_001219 [Streptosporangium becharense]|uniref:Uncharacterized protein n=1 Tax=Streptosporangium becharense TaxID=1816182 RepID=A0A7W9MFH4_9ACTN|nr:hypothetical protein [Streptosporangium becharense]MBB2909973.1 hypothetical protein [Streptosporangium becharense]MBB5819072.1 hypothetical protein [Streptosporangium becharense]
MHERPRRTRRPYSTGPDGPRPAPPERPVNETGRHAGETGRRVGGIDRHASEIGRPASGAGRHAGETDRSRLTWPPRIPEPGDDLPPSARWYGTPIPPPSRRTGRLRRMARALLVAGIYVGVITGIVAGMVAVIRALPEPPPPARASDPAAGVSHPLPEGWSAGAEPPVTAFTSAAGDGRTVTVMVRPAEPAADARQATAELGDLYARLLLHGDEVDVVDDRPITVGGRTGHSRAVRAEYLDVVNRPAYLRVVLLTGGGARPVVVVAVAQPDDPAVRAEIETVIQGLR